MKTMLLMLVASIVLSCSAEDDSATTNSIVIYSQDAYFASITLEEKRNMAEGQRITKIEATTNVGELRYEIVSQNPENGFRIDSQTGEVFANNSEAIKRFHGYELIAKIKIANGEFQNVVILTTSIENDQYEMCLEARNNMYNDLYSWISENNMVYSTRLLKTVEFIFSVSEDKTLCSYAFPHAYDYNIDTTAQVQLLDDLGQIMLTDVSNTIFVDPTGFGGYYLLNDLHNMDVLLENNTAYHLKITFNQNVGLVIAINNSQQNSVIPFPIELEDLNIIGTICTVVEGINQTDNPLINMSIGLVVL